MTENLKRCPFCGEKAVIQKIALGGGDFGFRVACSGNRCRAATHVRETRKEAKTEWNNRPIENELHGKTVKLEAENARLREALQMIATEKDNHGQLLSVEQAAQIAKDTLDGCLI